MLKWLKNKFQQTTKSPEADNLSIAIEIIGKKEVEIDALVDALGSQKASYEMRIDDLNLVIACLVAQAGTVVTMQRELVDRVRSSGMSVKFSNNDEQCVLSLIQEGGLSE